MSNAAFVVVCLSGACTVGFGLAFYGYLLVMDESEIEELKRQGRFIANNWTPPSMILRHWQTRPEVRRCLLFAVLSGVILGAALLFDAYFPTG